MSDEVVAIHGITAADVAGCPRFEQVAAEWRDFMEGCDLHGYNAKKFDVPILRWAKRVQQIACVCANQRVFGLLVCSV